MWPPCVSTRICLEMIVGNSGLRGIMARNPADRRPTRRELERPVTGLYVEPTYAVDGAGKAAVSGWRAVNPKRRERRDRNG